MSDVSMRLAAASLEEVGNSCRDSVFYSAGQTSVPPRATI